MITKAVFLIMYLWHDENAGRSSVGGPSLSVVPMPSIAICEKVGAVAKVFADQHQPTSFRLWSNSNLSKPAEYRCIEVDDTATQQPACSTK